MTRICRVLVVEDHAGIREVLGGALDRNGYVFTLLGSGERVRQAIADERHDIAIIDVPLMHDDAFALAALAADRGVGVILTTGHRERFAALEQSGHPCIFKPFQIEPLLRLVDRVLHELEIRCVRRKSRRQAGNRRA